MNPRIMALVCAAALFAAQAVAEEVPPPEQTATVQRDSARFTLSMHEAPRFVPIEGTTMAYVANARVPVIRVTPSSYYALQAGIWFVAPTLAGPWTVASVVPAVIYTIPPASPVHHVTYVRVYGSTSTTVHVGYTSGYVVPAYGATGVNVYGHWGDAVYTGTRSWGVTANGTTGTVARGSYATANGTTGDYAASRSFNPSTGIAQQGYGRTFETEGGATGAVARGEAYNTQTGVYANGAAGTVTGPQGETHSAAAGRIGDDRYANIDGTQYRNTGTGWQKRDASTGEWGAASRSRPTRQPSSSRPKRNP